MATRFNTCDGGGQSEGRKVRRSVLEGQGQGGTVREGNYDVLRNTSTGPVVCAVDQPQLVYSDARSRLHCSTSCLQNQLHCSSFNFKNVSAGAGSGFTCEHFTGYPYNFVVDPTCRHYAVRTYVLYGVKMFYLLNYVRMAVCVCLQLVCCNTAAPSVPSTNAVKRAMVRHEIFWAWAPEP